MMTVTVFTRICAVFLFPVGIEFFEQRKERLFFPDIQRIKHLLMPFRAHCSSLLRRSCPCFSQLNNSRATVLLAGRTRDISRCFQLDDDFAG